MKKQHFVLVILFSILFFQKVIAQVPGSDSTTSHIQIEKGISLYDEGKYDEALAIFNKVSNCDPNYSWACYESALAYYSQQKLEAALAKCREADDLKPEDVATISLIGSILDDMGKTSEAILYLNHALSTRPYNRSLLYNLATCYVRAGELEKAEQTIIRNIRINPYHKTSHLLLAKVNFYMGRVAQSYLAYNMAILLNPQVSYITEFENAISGKLDSLSHPYKYPYPAGVDHSNWDECTWFLKSEMAFNTNFDYDYKINYLTTRQSLMLLRKLNFLSSDTSVYSQLYARFFTELMKKDYFEALIFYSYKNSGNKEVNEWYEKNMPKNDAFVDWAQSTIDTWKCYGFSTANEARNVKTYHFGDNGKVASIGTMKTQPSESRYGEWLTINSDGWIEEEGSYVENELEDEWFLYWPDGKVRQHLFFHKGYLNGDIRTFHPNGARDGILPFSNGKKQGLHQEYTSSGNPLVQSGFMGGELDGKKINYYYDDGYRRDVFYTKGKTEGKVLYTWLNGNMKSEVLAKDSLYEGPYHTWYANGKPESEGNYKKGITTGKWVEYFPNGAKKTEGENDETGELTGKKINYYRNGNIEIEEESYTAGLLNGTYKSYFQNGKISKIITYKENKAVSIENFDINGKSLYTASEQNGELKFRNFYPNGILEMEGVLKNGNREGTWNFYDPLGRKTQQLKYREGLETGLQVKYHENGRIKEEYSSDSNIIIGPYKEYFSSGKTKISGAFNKSGRNGEWAAYFPNDSVQTRLFFTDNVQSGRQFYYTPSGKPETEFFMNDDGEIIRTRGYDFAGKIIYDHKYEYDSVLLTELYPSGELKVKKLMMNCKPHGVVEAYYPNGQLMSQKPYLYGLSNGTGKNWDYNGKLQNETTYLMGEINGIQKGYVDGKLWYTNPIENGMSQGIFSDYHSNGKTYNQFMFVDDKKHGNADFYSPDSSFMYRLVYYEDILIAYTYKNAAGEFLPEKPVTTETTEILCYYPNGKISARIPMKNGLYNGKNTTYYPDGSVFVEKMFVNGDFEGSYKSYYQNGKPKEVINYRNDERNGTYEAYFENGQKRKRGQFLAGYAQGEWLIYNETGKLVNTLYYDNDEIYDIK